ncbi:MAG: sodium:calcium antiporter [Candidatus Kapaibacterium sp.]
MTEFINYIESSLTTGLIFFLVFTAVILLAGTKLTSAADKLADLTKVGEALFGAIMLGAITSISGLIASVTAAFEGHSHLAVSNAIGGIAAQTAFLAIADIFYTKANLEHASASLQNIMLGMLLIGELTLILVLMAAPAFTFWGINIGSVLIIIVFIFGTKFISKAKKAPMWKPAQTSETLEDIPHFKNLSDKAHLRIWINFIILAAIVGLSGFLVAHAGIGIAKHSGISESFVGAVFIALSTSMPELVVSIAAVRQGSLNLAVGNIVGGNTFEVLSVSFSDMAYRGGSIYHYISDSEFFVVSITLLMMSVMIFGLLYRQRYGPGRIGWESLTILLLFVFAYIVLGIM